VLSTKTVGNKVKNRIRPGAPSRVAHAVLTQTIAASNAANKKLKNPESRCASAKKL